MKKNILAGITIITIAAITLGVFSCRKIIAKRIKHETKIGVLGTAPGEFDFDKFRLQCMAHDKSYLYVCDIGNNRVQRFNSDYEPVDWFGMANGQFGFYSFSVLPDTSFEPINIRIRNEIIYITCYLDSADYIHCKLIKMPESGEIIDIQDYCLNEHFYFHSTTFDVDRDGNIYFSGDAENGYAKVTKFNSAGKYVATFVNEVYCTHAAKLVIDNEDRIYYFSDRCTVFDSQGNIVKEDFGNMESYPADIYNNRIFHVDKNKILKEYDLDGKLKKKWKNSGIKCCSDQIIVTENLIFQCSWDNCSIDIYSY